MPTHLEEHESTWTTILRDIFGGLLPTESVPAGSFDDTYRRARARYRTHGMSLWDEGAER